MNAFHRHLILISTGEDAPILHARCHSQPASFLTGYDKSISLTLMAILLRVLDMDRESPSVVSPLQHN